MMTLAMAAPGPAFAQAVKVSTPRQAAPVVGLPPSLAAPAVVPAPSLAPASLTPSLLPAPSIVPAALQAAAKPAPRAALAEAARATAKLTPKSGAAESKDKAGRAFEGAASRRAESAEVAGAEGSGPAALSPAHNATTKGPAPNVPAPERLTLRARARNLWPAVLNAGVAAAVAFLLYKFGAPAAGVLPLLGLAGTLAWRPSPGNKAAFLAGIRNAAAPGTVIAYAKVGELGARLGLDADQAGELFTELVQEGHIAIRANRDAVYHGFRARAEEPGGPEHAADVLASNAVVLLNGSHAAGYARAVAKADKAVALYQGLSSPRLAEAEALRGNAMLEFATALLTAHKAALESRETLTPKLAARVADAGEALAWLQTATYQTGHVPAMPQGIHRKLVALIGSINPQAEAGDADADEAADGYIAALDLLEKFDPRHYLYEGPSKAAPEGAKPSDKLVAAFLAEVRARTSPGETLTRETMMRAGKELDLDAARMNAALGVLASRGQILILSNGKVVYFDLREQAEADRDGLWDLHNEAVDAIKQLNGTGLRDHLRAVARLDALHHRYFEARGRLDPKSKAYEQVLIALADAKLEAAAGVAEHQARTLKADDARLAGIRQAQAWLAHAYYSAERRQRITRESQKALNEAASLPAFRDALGGETEPPITKGVMLTRQFLSGMTAEDDASADADAPAPHPSGWRPLAPKDYPALTKYGVDLTGKAVDGKLPPMIGRKAEMRQVVKTLLRVEKNNPLIIGEKGVGKTALANGLASMIAAGELPELEGRSVVKLDLTKIVAGTTLRGQFEERMVAILEEAKKSNGRVLLFIDEIHMIVGTGDSQGSTDAANILKESLSDGSISVIGATTMEEYRKIEKDGALARRFNAVKLLPPTKDEAELIVEGVKSRYEEKHKVSIGAATVKAVAALAARYVTDRNLPDSALDLLDDASAEAELSGRFEVVPADIAAEIALRTGIPAGKVGAQERDQLKNLPAELGAAVIGQAEAVAKVAKGVQRGRMGLRNVKQPIGSFIFLGPTGVGKTEIARQTAKTVFGSEKNMVRLDMSEYMEKHSVSRMIGAPPGYAGFDQAGQLTEAVRRDPYSVILLDEIEKAHPEVLDVLLQVIEDGRLTDGQGRTVDFTNTIIMMTSNIGGSLAGDAEAAPKRNPIGFVTREETPETPSADGRRERYLAALKAKLRPEFINRVGEDGIVVFNELGKPEMEDILALRVRELEAQLKERGVTVTLSAAAKAEILKKAAEQRAYGARPLKQIVERQLSDAIVEAELEGRIGEGDAIELDWDAAKGAFTAGKK